MEKGNEQGLVARPVARGNADYAQIKALYREAFPAFERFSLPALRLFARKREVDFLAYYNPGCGDQLCGMTYTIEAGDYLYILYLAVSVTLRGGGYGTRILDQLKREHPGKHLVLEIEPLDKKAKNYDQRTRRLSFYEHNGFKLAGYDLFEGKVRYTMLATEDKFDPDAFSRAVRKLTHGLYRFKIIPVN
ncbi:MAG: GNAT family N-acetyltransferase [Eggerthellaceae bacterium]|nr:GNAT family N-acetyltransferase [Eggerthellaceae bacterium]